MGVNSMMVRIMNASDRARELTGPEITLAEALDRDLRSFTETRNKDAPWLVSPEELGPHLEEMAAQTDRYVEQSDGTIRCKGCGRWMGHTKKTRKQLLKELEEWNAQGGLS